MPGSHSSGTPLLSSSGKPPAMSSASSMSLPLQSVIAGEHSHGLKKAAMPAQSSAGGR